MLLPWLPQSFCTKPAETIARAWQIMLGGGGDSPCRPPVNSSPSLFSCCFCLVQGFFPFSSCIHDIACLQSFVPEKIPLQLVHGKMTTNVGGGDSPCRPPCEPLVRLLCFPKLACYGWSSPIFHNLANCCFLSLDFKGNFRANLTSSSSECELARIASPVSNNLFDKRNSWVFCHKFFFCAFSRLYVNCKPKLTN